MWVSPGLIRKEKEPHSNLNRENLIERVFNHGWDWINDDRLVKRKEWE